MKRNVILIGILMLTVLSFSSEAQIKIPKTSDLQKAAGLNLPTEAFTNDFMKALSPAKSLNLSSDQESKLIKNNSSFIDGVLGVLGGSGSDSDKQKKIGILQNDRKSFVEKLLGKGKASQYYALVKDKVQPLITKYALSKFLKI